MDNLKSFLDNELDLAAKTEVEAQLRNDEELSRMASDFRSISVSLKTADAGVPYGFDQLEAKLGKVSKPVESKKVWRIAWGSSALGLLLTLSLLPTLVGRGSRGQAEIATASTPAKSANSKLESDAVAGRALAPNTTAKESVQLYVPSDEWKRSLSQERSSTGFRSRLQDGLNTPLSNPKGIYLEKNGEVSVRVENLSRVIDEVNGIATSFKGFVVSSNMMNQQDGGTATVTMRVPTANFAAAMNRLQSMGEVISVSSNSQDITSETIDNSSRMETWALEEQRLIEELKRARKSSDRLAIRRQLIEVRANLQAYRAEVKSLKDRANFSTINATFVRGDTKVNGISGSWGDNTLRDAKDALGSTGKFFGALGIYALVFSPIWLPITIAALVIRKRNK
jgi:hypothetical protein